MVKYRNLIVYRILSRVLVLHRHTAVSMASSLTLLKRTNPTRKDFVDIHLFLDPYGSNFSFTITRIESPLTRLVTL